MVALELLEPNVWTIRSVPGLITVTRGWPDDSVDALLVLGSIGAAHGRRDDSNGQLVWKLDGPADVVVTALNALLPPGTPGAPSTPQDDPNREIT
jgi:hypothetical protein